MKKSFIILFLILIPLVFASKTETTGMLHLNDTATVYGKTLTVLSATSIGKLKVNVDGVKGIAMPGVNKTTNVNEMYIEILNFTYIDSETFDVGLKITVHNQCGDGGCKGMESKISCCTDCGCEEGLACVDNICIEGGCDIDWACADDDACTVDKCSGTPKICSNTPITDCVNGDECCPSSCSSENDDDCAAKGEEKVEEPVQEEEEQPEETEETEKQEVVEDPEEESFTEKEKGIFIIAGVALLVVIVGFFIFGRK